MQECVAEGLAAKFKMATKFSTSEFAGSRERGPSSIGRAGGQRGWSGLPTTTTTPVSRRDGGVGRWSASGWERSLAPRSHVTPRQHGVIRQGRPHQALLEPGADHPRVLRRAPRLLRAEAAGAHQGGAGWLGGVCSQAPKLVLSESLWAPSEHSISPNLAAWLFPTPRRSPLPTCCASRTWSASSPRSSQGASRCRTDAAPRSISAL